MEPTLEKQLREELEQLAPKHQRAVLNYVRNLGTSGMEKHDPRRLLQFVGCIDPADLDLMSEAIEAGCEQVADDEW